MGLFLPCCGPPRPHPALPEDGEGEEWRPQASIPLMCGIAAVIATADNLVPPALCARLDAALAHRGPDASGLATFRRDGTPVAP